jgi:protein-disulfide isomerase
MKGFYIGLGALAVGGVGVLVVAMSRGGATLPSGPINVEAIEMARSWPGYVLGDPEAPVEIIEYADFECAGCRVQWVLTVQDIKQRLVATGQARLTFRDFPLTSHMNSAPAHHAAACAADQGMFQQMHDKLFDTQPQWTGRTGAESMFRGYARELGLDLEEYDACTGEGRHRGRLQASYEGGLALGVNSTPTFIVGDHLYTDGVTYDLIKALVDSIAAIGEQ